MRGRLPEAIGLGIDNLEHGLLVDTEFFSGKQPNQCPGQSETLGELQAIDISGPAVRQLISALVRRGVAVTSTLAIFETFTAHAQLDPRTLDVLVPRLQEQLPRRTGKAGGPECARHGGVEPAVQKGNGVRARVLRRRRPAARGRRSHGLGRRRGGIRQSAAGGTARRRRTAARGGHQSGQRTRRLLPRGWPHRLVKAGLQADLFVVNGNPAANISDIRNVEVVFKKGLAYDPAKLIAATQGTVGRFDISIYTRSRWLWLAGVLFAILIARRLRRRFGSHPV